MEYLTVKELAELLKVSQSWVRVNMKTIPHYKIGKNVRFDKEKIKEYINKTEKNNE